MALIFDASFESGNLAEAQLVCESPLEYDLHIRPDTLNTRHRVWFYFSVRGAIRGQKVLINLVGHSKTKSLYRDGMAPVVSSSRRPYWERMPEGCVYYYRSARHNKQYVLSFPFCFERAGQRAFFDRLAREVPFLRGYTDAFGHSLVVGGGVDAMVDLDLNEWDAAATRLLNEGAGGRTESLAASDGAQALQGAGQVE